MKDFWVFLIIIILLWLRGYATGVKAPHLCSCFSTTAFANTNENPSQTKLLAILDLWPKRSLVYFQIFILQAF